MDYGQQDYGGGAMKTFVLALSFIGVSSAVWGQTTCASQSQSVPIATQNGDPISTSDTAEHLPGGSHGVIGGYISSPPGNQSTLLQQCTYSGTPPQSPAGCNTACDITVIPAFTGSPAQALTAQEIGGLTTFADHHEVSVSWLPAHNFAIAPTQGISCTGSMGYAVGSCLLPGCGVEISGITIGADSTGKANATVNLAPGSAKALSSQAVPFPLSCGLFNPNGGGGGGNCTPNPNNPFQVGPVGDFHQTDPGSDPPPPCTVSPIIIDVDGKGFHLTSAAQGVVFDIRGDGHPIQMAWTDPGFQNAFLALPGPDGVVHTGKELFGDYTQQPKSIHPNGFLAFAEYDKPENGGNGDGIIDEHDAVFSKLRLWIDVNHDGISQPTEMHTLPELGIRSLALAYFESRRTDEFGNDFLYKARINPRREDRDPRDEGKNGEPGRWAYDVFFVTK